jgi:hypothetical protein
VVVEEDAITDIKEGPAKHQVSEGFSTAQTCLNHSTGFAIAAAQRG